VITEEFVAELRADAEEVNEVCEERTVTIHDTYDEQTDAKKRHEGIMKNLAQMAQHQTHAIEKPPAGVKPLSGRWVEDKLPDGTYKMRWTARGYEQGLTGFEDHYAGTPAHGLLRTLLIVACLKGLSVAFGDCAQAFLQAPLQEAVWIWPPPEACVPEGHAWRCLKAMPGLKGAPAAWGAYASEMLEKMDLYQSKVDTSVHSNPELLTWALRHADDFAVIGPFETLPTKVERMEKDLLLRDVQYFDKPGTRIRFLGRIYTRLEDGFTEENDPSIENDVIRDAGLDKATHLTKTPGAKEAKQADDDYPSDRVAHRYYRTQVGRLIYLSYLRGDMQYSIGQLARHVQAPTRRHQRLLKRCIRYLKRTRGAKQHIQPHGPLRVHGHGDSDWASDEESRKSCSGGVLYLAGAPVLTYSRTQAVQALSSCEAELYAMGSLSKEAMFLVTFLQEQGLATTDMVPTIYSDSSSAIRVGCRLGLQKQKHIELRYLALQTWKQQKRVQFAKIGTDANDSDFLTKYVSYEIMRRCMHEIGLKTSE